MKEYTNKNPVFSESIRVTETSDPAHADNINAAPKQLLQNTLICYEKACLALDGLDNAATELADIKSQIESGGLGGGAPLYVYETEEDYNAAIDAGTIPVGAVILKLYEETDANGETLADHVAKMQDTINYLADMLLSGTVTKGLTIDGRQAILTGSGAPIGLSWPLGSVPQKQ